MSAPGKSVVVPVDDLLFYKLKDLITEQSEGEWTDEMVVKDAHHFANHLRPLLAAAPAPSSLAGGEVTNDQIQSVMLAAIKEVRATVTDAIEGACMDADIIRMERGTVDMDDTGWAVMRAVHRRLAALSPEAPAREGWEEALIDRLKTLALLLRAEAGEKDGLARQDDLDAAEAVNWAVARISTLTPRHEAPASDMTDVEAIAIEIADTVASPGLNWSVDDHCRSELHAHTVSSVVSILEGRHEAPAEGAGEAEEVRDAVAWLEGAFPKEAIGFSTAYRPTMTAVHTVLYALRAQPQAREEAKPVTWAAEIAKELHATKLRLHSGKVTLGDMDAIMDAVFALEGLSAQSSGGCTMSISAEHSPDESQATTPLTFTPFSDELREAQAALEPFAFIAERRPLSPAKTVHLVHLDGTHIETIEANAFWRARHSHSALRARSSAPEAREGEAVAWLLENHGSGTGPICRDHPGEWPNTTVYPLFKHPAAPSADKLRIAVEDIVERVKTGAQGSTVQALGALSDIEQIALSALKAEGAK